jgi:putative membrane protein
MQQLIAGSVAGLAATVPMSIAMAAMHRQLPPHERYALPPREVTVGTAERLGAEELTDEEPEREAVTWVSHLGYGAATGAMYGALAERVPVPALASGVLWGLIVWSGSYLGWLPAAGIRASATRQPPRREALMIAAHVVFGAFLGLTYGALRGTGNERSPVL